ncbi:peptide-methionine (S)-S-oxide reductase [Neisseria iguanae]|uniref:peptide-methionine (S)-S-oxide reductase n=1 Tax=Neisseria iguanae TaxID=90242 RepID=UPI002481BDB9|nr:peptide-methionine (S)-S-oxide reductase [Neisseria iguanae]
MSTADEPVIRVALAAQQQKHAIPIVIECEPLQHFYPTEDYHQDYLGKNPNGYCHINILLVHKPLSADTVTPRAFAGPSESEIQAKLGSGEYYVTQQSSTERPLTATRSGRVF